MMLISCRCSGLDRSFAAHRRNTAVSDPVSKPRMTRAFQIRAKDPDAPRSQRPSVKVAYGFASSGGTSIDTLAAAETVQKCLQLMQARKLDSLTDYLANECLADAPSLQTPDGTVMTPFEDLIASMLLEQPEQHFLDTYAIRNLLHSTPAHMQALSGLMTAPGRFMQRVAITARSGEECVLTFTLEGMPTQPPAPPSAEAFTPFSDLQEPPALPGGTINSIPSMSPDVRLHPSGNDNGKTTNASSSSGSSGGPTTPAITGTGTGSNSSAGAAGGRAAVAGSAYIWKLRCVRGEPALPLPDHPSAPSPEYPPEVLVAASLSALQECNLSTPFSLLSPASQALLGKSQARFAAAVRDNVRYRVLYGHIHARSIRRCQNSASTYLELVACTSASGARAVFCYILGRQPMPSSNNTGNTDAPNSSSAGTAGAANEDELALAGCWCIEHVKVLDDPRLIAAIDATYWPGKKKSK